MKKRKLIAAAITVMTMLATAVMPAYATETTNPYPLQGTFPYTIITRENVDARLTDGWVFTGDPYANVGTAIPFTNNTEWAQVNDFKSSVTTGINSGKILITLAGLTSTPDAYSGSALTVEEEAVKNEVIKYLGSYDWKNASDYEKAAYTAEYIATRCTYGAGTGDSWHSNNVYSCLIEGISLCDGYTQTYHLLTRAAGLKSVNVSDRALNHAWNYVMIDGVWYEMDITSVASHNLNLESHQRRIKEYLAQPATNTSQYIWAEKGLEMDFDSTIPSQPVY